MVFNTTFNNISFISWRIVLLVEECGVPRDNYRPDTNKRYHILFYQVKIQIKSLLRVDT